MLCSFFQDRILQGLDPTTNSVPEHHIEKTFAEFCARGIFSEVDSKQSLDNFLQTHGDVLKPIPVKLSTKEIFRKDGSIKKEDRFAYASPFLASSQRLLCMLDVLHCVDNPLEHVEGVIRSYKDGNYARNHPILSDPNALAIVVCFDELEISSPIGPSKIKIALYY